MMNIPATTSSRLSPTAPTIERHALRALRDKRFDGDRPPRIGPVTTAQINNAINALETYLLPADQPWVIARITTMLAHYWTPAMPEKLHDAVIREWLDIVGGFPILAVQKACEFHVSTEEKRRPTPAIIAQLCQEYAAVEIDRCAKLKKVLQVSSNGPEPVERTPPTESEKAHASKLVRDMVEGFNREDQNEVRA